MLRNCFFVLLLSLCSVQAFAQPRIALSTTTLDFGNIHYKAGGTTICPVKQRRIVLYNKGTDSLVIKKVYAQDEANLPELESSLIAPDDSTELFISCRQLSNMPEGGFSREITILSNDPVGEHSIRCLGHLTPLDFSFDMSDTNIVCIRTHGSVKAYIRTFYLDNRSDSTLTIDSIAHANGCRIIPSGYRLGPQSRMKFQALLKPLVNQAHHAWHNKIFFKGMSYEVVHLRLNEGQGGHKKPCQGKRKSGKTLSS